ncbi:MAG: lysophospholipid acyltransferase family protein [Bacteroidales bacterium]|nr:lysophospholipid acyltransferase family protein [Bacteroidales bacterium]
MITHFLVYLFFRTLIFLFKLIPLKALYVLSDIITFFLQNVFKYRYKIAQINIMNSFPDKSVFEYNKIIKKHYKHLSDLIIETIKGFTLNTKIENYIKPINLEIMEDLYNKYNGIIGILGHYGNWEWAGILAGLKLKQKPIIFYTPLSNKYIDKYLRKLRAKSGCLPISIKYTKRAFEEFAHKKSFFAMVADQSPSNLDKSYWFRFLNQDTPCIHGPEKYAKYYNLPVVYVKIDKIKRGNYTVLFKIITTNPNNEPEGEITKKFFSNLENDIKEKPHLWLWTHRRWKHKKLT